MKIYTVANKGFWSLEAAKEYALDMGIKESEIVEISMDSDLDYLQEFCKEEAPFRLRAYFDLSDEKVEEYSGEVEEIIRDTIDNCEELYDAMDDRIKELLGDDYIEPDFFDEDEEEDEEEDEDEE